MGSRGPLKIVPPVPIPSRDEPVEETAQTRIRSSAPRKPDKLPAGGSKVWDEIIEALDEAGMIASCDGPTLELAVRHYLAAVKASNALMRESVTKLDKKNGRVMKNPANQVFRDHSTAFLEFAKQLGLSFVARARVPVRDEGDGDDGNPFK